MTLSIRVARPDDYGEVATVILSSYQEYQATMGELWDHYRADLADVAGRVARGVVLVAELEGRIAGTVTYYLPNDDGSREDWFWWPPNFAYLRALGVDPAVRGRGVGRALSLAVIDAARGASAAGVALNTVGFMAAAIALYEDLGFRRVAPDSAWEDYPLLSYTLELSDMEVSR